MSLRAILNNVIVADMNFDERFTNAGLVLLGDDKKDAGIRPRWAEVFAVGPDEKEIKVGQYVLVAHGRWTRGIDFEGRTLRRIDNDDILLVSDSPQVDETLSQYS